MTSSQTGGYILPIGQPIIPRNLTFTQFIQTVIVGVSGLPGTSVRPKWQIAPPKQLDITQNWISFGIAAQKPDPHNYVGVNQDGSNFTQRNEVVDVTCSVYGPDAVDLQSLISDNLQLPQNCTALTIANMGLVETTSGIRMPEVVNERWMDRVDFSIVIRRLIQREYPIVTFAGANGTIYSDPKDLSWIAQER